jgi:hypothetical protein
LKQSGKKEAVKDKKYGSVTSQLLKQGGKNADKIAESGGNKMVSSFKGGFDQMQFGKGQNIGLRKSSNN